METCAWCSAPSPGSLAALSEGFCPDCLLPLGEAGLCAGCRSRWELERIPQEDGTRGYGISRPGGHHHWWFVYA